MKHLFKLSITCIGLLFCIGCSDDDSVSLAQWEVEVNELKAAMAKYEDVNVATSEGFFDVSGFVPNMGHHFLLPIRVDGTFELMRPEIVLYAPDASGNMEFVAVEYVTPVADLDNPGSPPEGFTGSEDQWHLNTRLSQWQLHVWIGKDNPDGVFAEFNPEIGTGN